MEKGGGVGWGGQFTVGRAEPWELEGRNVWSECICLILARIDRPVSEVK
jgi:hypothetical protein